VTPDAQNVVLTPLTVGIMVAIVGVLGIGGKIMYEWVRSQVRAERADWEKGLADLRAENVQLRADLQATRTEVHNMSNGQNRAMRELGKALGATDLSLMRTGIENAMAALSGQ
jgi:cell division protein FtsB